MKNRIFLLALFVLSGIIGCGTNDTPTEPVSMAAGDGGIFARSNNGEIIPGQYIVLMHDGVLPGRLPEVASEIAHRHSATVDRLYRHTVRGFAVRMSAADAAALARDPRVRLVEPDRIVQIEQDIDDQGNGKPKGGGAPPVQDTAWGVKNVGGAGDGTSKIAWIIDSGIDLDHPDLNVDLVNAANFASGTGPDDGNGHGTHVAGIVAAKNNGVGVIGVAAGATVVPVRVLGNSGTGSTSGVIAGVDYVASKATPNDVVNMSLGGPLSSALDEAVRGLARRGVPVVIAAGNDDVNASTTSPARVDTANVYTISAIGTNGCLASWSNFGAIVDYAAPGVGIKSTYKGGAYKSLSGTSMAAPHVAGIILLGPVNTSGTACSDPDGIPDPLAHR